MKHALWAVVTCLTLFPVLGEAETQHRPCTPANRKLALTVRSETWRDDKPYDISAEIKRRLADARIAVVDDSTPSKDAVLLADYAEEAGSPYFPAGRGTNIHLRLRILEPTELKSLRELTIAWGPPASVAMGDLYSAAVRNVLNDKRFRQLGHIVAATLGDRCSAERLLPLALAAPELVLPLIDGAKYKPASPKDEMLLAVARAVLTKDYRVLDNLDTAGADSLLMVFTARSWFDNNEQLFEHTARALARIGDRRAAKPLMDLLRDMRDRFTWGCDANSGPGCRRMVTMAVSFADALGALGDKLTMVDLDDLAEKGSLHPDIIAAVKRAAGAIRERQRK